MEYSQQSRVFVCDLVLGRPTKIPMAKVSQHFFHASIYERWSFRRYTLPRYHGTRSNCFWLFLDWIPIVLNVGVLSFVFWNGYFQNWKIALLFGLPPTLAATLLQLYFGFHSVLYSTLAYLSLFLSAIASLIFWIRKKGSLHLRLLGFAMISVGLSFLARLAERSPHFDFLTMGTHFLWHIFGAMTCHLVLLYLHRWQVSEKHVNN